MANPSTPLEFGEILRKQRIRAGVGLRELARRLGRSPGYLSDVENGHVPPPSEEVIVGMAAALDVDRQILLRAARKMDPDLAAYVARKQEAADFLRLARDREFEPEDWDRIRQLAERARLGRRGKEKA